MQFKTTFLKSMEMGLSLAMIAVLALAACGGGGGETYIVATQLSGTNGDMSKYLGTWVTGCAINYTLLSLTTVRADGVINKFDLTAISGVRAQGTLTINTYNSSTSCSGTASQRTENVFLQYASNVAITTPPDKTAFFAGSADRIDLGVIGTVATTPYNIGFRSNFSQFQVAAASSVFSSSNLRYTKQ